ncbi:hypothetical protein J7560_09800 [Wohlfahrtiimonas chitiniclastica]|uniref:hypothetical protein n=1 Tax=Wohlfahrtiimonas chitiniclastica TaxID=400946 RepID=UPI0007B69880|nr:hypothetical protein [Wohlfahrtiimonas chitiniclastica]KZX37275.1 hypothetical protein A6V30_10050 [Wohlfahrtiimonas chitiniclastica]MBS7815702.1 hypothetical protein [Wohlfahrtiimonas chitiniclastica]
MNMTQHMTQRANQRGISTKMIDLVYRFGKESVQNDRIVLDKNLIKDLEQQCRAFLKELERIKKKQGLTLVVSEDTVITGYFNGK